MILTSWNVNSLKTLRHYHPWNEMKRMNDILDALKADMLCFQEVKISRQKLEREYALVEGYDSYFSFNTKRPGASGVATYVKSTCPLKPVAAVEGFRQSISPIVDRDTEDDNFDFTEAELEDMDREGRVLVTDHKEFVLFNVYCPNETGPERMPFKMRFYQALEWRSRQLIRTGRHVVIAGDINACSTELDHVDPLKSNKEHGLDRFEDHPARQWLNHFCQNWVTDTFRHFYPDQKGAYTVWNTLINARPVNYGARIDYILVDKAFVDQVVSIRHDTQVMGSDHCPITIEFKPFSGVEGDEDGYKYTPPALCSRFYAEFRQKTILDYFNKPHTTSSVSKSAPALKKPGTHPPQPPKKTPILQPEKKKQKLALDPKQRKLTDYFKKKDPAEQPVDEQQKASGVKPPSEKHELVAAPPNKSLPEEFLTEKQREVKNQWAMLTQPKPVPKCYHKEPAQEFTVNKSGQNKGRKFYLCARPVGPTVAGDSGEEKMKRGETEFRCGFFQWKNGGGSTSGVINAPKKRRQGSFAE